MSTLGKLNRFQDEHGGQLTARVEDRDEDHLIICESPGGQEIARCTVPKDDSGLEEGFGPADQIERWQDRGIDIVLEGEGDSPDEQDADGEDADDDEGEGDGGDVFYADEERTYETFEDFLAALGDGKPTCTPAGYVINALETEDQLDAVAAAEKSGKDRDCVHDALTDRRQELNG